MATISELAADLVAARNAEQIARDERIAIEERIVQETGIGDNHRQTLKTNNGLKLVVQTGYNYRLAKNFDGSVVPHKQKVSYDLDVKAYEALEGASKQAAAQYVTVSEKKPSVTVSVQ